jgi:uncharacterized RDD family membrane protein YckC
MTDSSQTRLLRLAAFLVDALSMSLILILPASILSYGVALIGGDMRAIQIVWLAALAILTCGMLLRDGFRGRSWGKHLLGLRLVTPAGDGCGYGRSIVRNLPLVIPGWNLLEIVLVLAKNSRSGDRIARTIVTEE